MDDDDVRRMLRTALVKDEKQHRDIVGSAVKIVLRRRRRVRACGATASGMALAVGATAAVWVGGPSGRTHPEPSLSTITTTASTTSEAATPSQWDKDDDIVHRLPGLLNPLLPQGFSVTKSSTSPLSNGFLLKGPSGDNDFTLSVAAKSQRNRAMEEICVAGGVCSHHQVSGGTLYIQTKNFTADYGGNSGYAPGTGKQVLNFSDEYEFVPSSADGRVIDVKLAAAVSHEHYAPKPPKDWPGPWPPQDPAGETFNASGVMLSPDDFAALIAKPGFAAVASVLDPSTPVDSATLARHKTADATIAAAVKPILPPGFTLAIGSDAPDTPGEHLTLTGPSGANLFSWATEPQQRNWHHGQACQNHTEQNCTWKDVPGGEIEITHSIGGTVMPMDTSLYAPGQADTRTTSGEIYKYLPDDPNGTVIELSTAEQLRDIPWAATRPTSGVYADPGRPWPPPARTGEPFNAGGPLLSVDQFAALVRAPGIADIVRTVNTAFDPLGGNVGFQVWG